MYLKVFLFLFGKNDYVDIAIKLKIIPHIIVDGK